jgi:hypothetical protein
MVGEYQNSLIGLTYDGHGDAGIVGLSTLSFDIKGSIFQRVKWPSLAKVKHPMFKKTIKILKRVYLVVGKDTAFALYGARVERRNNYVLFIGIAVCDLESQGWIIQTRFIRNLRWATGITTTTKKEFTRRLTKHRQTVSLLRIRGSYNWDTKGNFYIVEEIPSQPGALAVILFEKKTNYMRKPEILLPGLAKSLSLPSSPTGSKTGPQLIEGILLSLPTGYNKKTMQLHKIVTIVKRKCPFLKDDIIMLRPVTKRIYNLNRYNFFMTNDGQFIAWPRHSLFMETGRVYADVYLDMLPVY